MKVEETKLAGVVLLTPNVFGDDRGFFMETYNRDKAVELGLPGEFVQDNHSCSHKGVLRGLHFQKAPHAQGKLVRVIQGSAFDVAVDIRNDSPTFGKTHKVLSGPWVPLLGLKMSSRSSPPVLKLEFGPRLPKVGNG